MQVGMRTSRKNVATHQRLGHIFGGPVVRHRHFPAAIGLWFAALFGLTTLALPAKVMGMVLGRPAPSLGLQLTWAVCLAALAGLAAFRFAGRKLAKMPAAVAPHDDEKEADTADAFPVVPSAVLSERSIEPLNLASLFTKNGEPLPNASPPHAAQQIDPVLQLNPAQQLDQQSRSAPARQAATPLHTPGRSPVADAPLNTLGVVELLERLAFALDNWRTRNPDGKLPHLPSDETIYNLSHLSQWSNDPSRRTASGEPGHAFADDPDECDFEDCDNESADPDDAADDQSDNRYASLIDMTARAQMRPQSESGPSSDASLQHGSQLEVADQALEAALAQLERLSLPR